MLISHLALTSLRSTTRAWSARWKRRSTTSPWAAVQKLRSRPRYRFQSRAEGIRTGSCLSLNLSSHFQNTLRRLDERMRALKRVMRWSFAGIVVLIFGYMCFVFGPPFIRPLYLPKLRYEIPDGYRGWVQFEVSNPACPPLGRDGRFLVYVVDAKGRGCTSSPIAEGWRTVRYQYVLTNGERHNLPDTGWGKG